MSLGERVRELRYKAGLLQTELAERAGVTIHRLRGLEESLVKPTWDTVERLAAALGTSVMTFTNVALAGLKGWHVPIYFGPGGPQRALMILNRSRQNACRSCKAQSEEYL